MAFIKTDMSFVHYKWDAETAGAASIFIGEPTRRIFDPFNGEQVLLLINHYALLIGKLTLGQVRILENKIAYRLPLSLKSELSVFKWLIDQPLDERETAAK